MAGATILARAWVVFDGFAFCDLTVVTGIAAPQRIAVLNAVAGPVGSTGVTVFADVGGLGMRG